MRLNSEAACREFLATQAPSSIAGQLQHDRALCEHSRFPSILVHYLPSANTVLGDNIALELFPETAAYPRSIRMAQYKGIITIIKSSLQNMPAESKHEPLPVCDQNGREVPSKEQLQTALVVLDFCLKSDEVVNLTTPLQEVVQILRDRVGKTSTIKATSSENSSGTSVRTSKRKKCYICQYLLLAAHPLYKSLCKPCGDFNLASSSISLPDRLSLKGKFALVTGGRINLGYHTALRLLRCGARVVVSSRYPRDAESRYMAETDSGIWCERLKIIGADFRAASDVFRLVSVIKECLTEWSADGTCKLDILINNAAQTLTDSLQKEQKAVSRESKLRLEDCHFKCRVLLGEKDYAPRIRGGVQISNTIDSTSPLFLEPDGNDNITTKPLNYQSRHENPISKHEADSKSSWVQSLHQIPYEDVISAHSVNTFVPLILLREFLPIMGSLSSQPTLATQIISPSAYIINVTSREGIFESSPTSSSKNGRHVHTNLTKAALNMLTETEAAPAWRKRRVAINNVDPGFMSAAPEVEKRWKEREGEGWRCPIGWEDGAGRVLWPIAIGEIGKGMVWGRLLKHFGSVEVDVGLGR